MYPLGRVLFKVNNTNSTYFYCDILLYLFTSDCSVIGHQIVGRGSKTVLLILFKDGFVGQIGLYESFYHIKKEIVQYVIDKKLCGKKGFGIVTKFLTNYNSEYMSLWRSGLHNNITTPSSKNKETMNEKINYISTVTIESVQKLKWTCLCFGIDVSQLGDYYTKEMQNKNEGSISVSCANYTYLSNKIKNYKRKGISASKTVVTYENYCSLSWEDQNALHIGLETESMWKDLQLSVCHICQSCTLATMKKKKFPIGEEGALKAFSVCNSCDTDDNKYSVENLVTPYWINDDGNKCTDVPLELQSLTFAEKQLIALATSHMNLVHLKNGTLGSTGHVVALEQNITNVAVELPRLPTDINIIKVVRRGMSKDQQVYEKMFKVNKDRVLKALYWLVKYNTLYKDYNIIINENNLSWMGNKKIATLPVKDTVVVGETIEYDDGDLGPSPSQTLTDILHEKNADYDVYGK